MIKKIYFFIFPNNFIFFFFLFTTLIFLQFQSKYHSKYIHIFKINEEKTHNELLNQLDIEDTVRFERLLSLNYTKILKEHLKENYQNKINELKYTKKITNYTFNDLDNSFNFGSTSNNHIDDILKLLNEATVDIILKIYIQKIHNFKKTQFKSTNFHQHEIQKKFKPNFLEYEKDYEILNEDDTQFLVLDKSQNLSFFIKFYTKSIPDDDLDFLIRVENLINVKNNFNIYNTFSYTLEKVKSYELTVIFFLIFIYVFSISIGNLVNLFKNRV